jgi:hypothetical protein
VSCPAFRFDATPEEILRKWARRSPRAEIDCAALLRMPAEARLVRRSQVSYSFFFSSCPLRGDRRHEADFFSPFFFVAFLVGGSNSQVHFSMTNLFHRNVCITGGFTESMTWAAGWALVLVDRIGAGGG